MNMTVTLKLNLKTKEVSDQVAKAAKAQLKDTVIDVTQEAKQNSPVSEQWPSIDKSGRRPTGNNRRSINWQVGPGGDVELSELQGAVYSTSGYGGYLETGTRKMPARPYIKPAADKHFTEEKFGKGMKERLA